MSRPEPTQEFFSIGEVCALTDLRPHVLRYWEGQFKFLHPAKNRSGNRVYRAKEIELILLVKQLLYTDKYTIEGARQKLDEFRRDGSLKKVAHQAASHETIRDVMLKLDRILAILDGQSVPEIDNSDAPTVE